MEKSDTEIDVEYDRLMSEPSDINEHLEVIAEFASYCDVVCEFGVRGGTSTVALLAGRPERVISVEISTPEPQGIARMAKEAGIQWDFVQGDSLSYDMPEVDLLMIDSRHTKDQLRSELARHAAKVKRFIILHDVGIFWYEGEGKYEEGGLGEAVMGFLHTHLFEWSIVYATKKNNGLMILEKRV